MNEELLNELSEAMKRRDKAAAAIARWTEQKMDAEEDIKELSARITGAEADDEEEDEVPLQPEPSTFDGFAPTVWVPEQV